MSNETRLLKKEIFTAASASVTQTGTEKLLAALQNQSGDIKGWAISFVASLLVSSLVKYGIDLSLSDAIILVTLLSSGGSALINGWAKRRQDVDILKLKGTLGGLEDIPVIGPATQQRAEHVVAYAAAKTSIPMTAEKWKAEMDKAKVDIKSSMK